MTAQVNEVLHYFAEVDQGSIGIRDAAQWLTGWAV
jgi:hypothetical protein